MRLLTTVGFAILLFIVFVSACAPRRADPSDTQQACRDRRGEVVLIHGNNSPGSYDSWFCAAPGVGR